MSNESISPKAKPRLAGRGITYCVPPHKVASLLYTTRSAGAIPGTPIWPALIDSAATRFSGIWRWLP
jgi:hypothetical protein